MKNNKGYYSWIHSLNRAALQSQQIGQKMINEERAALRGGGEEGLKQGRTRIHGFSRPSMAGQGDIPVSVNTDPESDPIFATAKALGELIQKVNQGPGGPGSQPLHKGLEIPMNTNTAGQLMRIARAIHGKPEQSVGGADLGYEEVDTEMPETTRGIGKPASAEEFAAYSAARQQKMGQIEPQPEPNLAPPGDLDGDGDADASDVQIKLDRDFASMEAQAGVPSSQFGNKFGIPNDRESHVRYAQAMMDEHGKALSSGDMELAGGFQELMSQFKQHARGEGHHDLADTIEDHLIRHHPGHVSIENEMPVQEQKQYFIKSKINKFLR